MFHKATLLLVAFTVCLLSGQVSGQEFSPYGNSLARLTIKEVTVVAEVVSSPQKLYLGLSHRKELPEGSGMLFLLDTEKRHVFCMRDMLISIDIVWIAGGKVAGLHKQLSPKDKSSFTSPVPVRLVLEVPGGFVDRHGIKVGDPVVLQMPGF